MKNLFKSKTSKWILAIIVIIVLYMIYKKRKAAGKKLPFGLGGSNNVVGEVTVDGSGVTNQALVVEDPTTGSEDMTVTRVATRISNEGDDMYTGNTLSSTPVKKCFKCALSGMTYPNCNGQIAEIPCRSTATLSSSAVRLY